MDVEKNQTRSLFQIVIKRYFTRSEIYEKLKKMKEKGKLPEGLCFKGDNVMLGEQVRLLITIFYHKFYSHQATSIKTQAFTRKKSLSGKKFHRMTEER